MLNRVLFMALLSALLVTAACKKKEAEVPAGGSAAAGSAAAAEGSAAAAGSAAPAAGKELADAAAPAGLTWKRSDVPFGSIEVPQGDGWSMPDVTQIEGPDGVVIMLQAQDGISPDQTDEYLASYNDVQKRDAPKYAGKGETKGTVAGQPAVRVEGAFDNGTRFVTRDYLIFTKGKVVVLGSRIPEEHAAKLPGVIDHLARSLQAK
jgi:hypothetical protein